MLMDVDIKFFSVSLSPTKSATRLSSVVINWEKMSQAIVNIPGIPLDLRRITWGVSTFLDAGILRNDVSITGLIGGNWF